MRPERAEPPSSKAARLSLSLSLASRRPRARPPKKRTSKPPAAALGFAAPRGSSGTATGSGSGSGDGGAGAEDDRSGGGMGLHAEGHHQAEEHPRGQARAAVQLRGLHDALHVRLSPPMPPSSSAPSRPLSPPRRPLGFPRLDPLRSGPDLGFCSPSRRTIYNMCTQKPPHDYSQQLYDKYRESFEEYITSMVSRLLISPLALVNARV